MLQSRQTAWSLVLGAFHSCREWYSFALVGVVLSICQAEAPLHPYLLLSHVLWRVLLLCVLWLAVGGCIHILRSRLRPRHKQVSSRTVKNITRPASFNFIVFALRFQFLVPSKAEPEQRFQREVVAQNRNNQYTRSGIHFLHFLFFF